MHFGNLSVNKKIGDRIRKYRQLAGLNQEIAGEEIGMSGGNFGKIERGEIDINTDYLQKLAKLFKVTVSDFFDDRPIHSLNEKNANYGYASQVDLDHLTELVKNLAIEVEKIHEKLPAKQTTKKVKPKK